MCVCSVCRENERKNQEEEEEEEEEGAGGEKGEMDLEMSTRWPRGNIFLCGRGDAMTCSVH